MHQWLHQRHHHRQLTSLPHPPKLSHSSRTLSGLVKPRELLTNPYTQHGEHGGEAGPEEDRAARQECRVQPKAIRSRHHED